MAELFIIIICPLTTFKEKDEESPTEKLKLKLFVFIGEFCSLTKTPLLTVDVYSAVCSPCVFSPHPAAELLTPNVNKKCLGWLMAITLEIKLFSFRSLHSFISPTSAITPQYP